MKKCTQYVKEEVDIRKSKGIPADFMSKAEEEARQKHRIRIDDEAQMRTIWPEFERNMRESNSILTTGPDGRRLNQQQMRDRIRSLEILAENVVRDMFGELLDSSIKPIELDIKLVPMGEVTSEIEDITDVPQQPEEPEEPETPEEPEDEEEKKEEEKEEKKEEEIGTDLVSAIDKKKILNMITQAAGKATKDVIRASDIVDAGLENIFGANWRRILDCWVRISDLADKMDWVIPIDRKSDMMRNAPQGMAGACQVKWESFTGNYYDLKLLLEKEATKIVIHAAGVDFPMLIHETIKGIYIFLQSGAIKKDKKTAEIIKKATSSFMDEAQDFRYGPPALQMLLLFVNAFPESNQYKKLDTKVFTILAIDKQRAIEEAKAAKVEHREYLEKKANIALTDDEFLETMKSIFSVFDLQAGQYVVNQEKFNKSTAKVKIKKIIDYIVEDAEEYKKKIEEYERDLEEWEREQKEREEYQKYSQTRDDEFTPSKPEESKEEDEEDYDYSKLPQKRLHELVNDALERGDIEEVKKISKFLKEGAQIYLREVERLNESYNFHTRRK